VTWQGELLLLRMRLLLRRDGRCEQGCGKRLRRGQLHFCSDLCRSLYTPATWGEGKGIVVQFRASLYEIRRERKR
jgi:hypothetical protein